VAELNTLYYGDNLDVLRRHVEHSIAITANGPEILTRV
jgi:hypothetical protein